MDQLSIDQLLSIAIAIECNGAEFYRTAAGMVQSPMREEFLEMAEMEEGHAASFGHMKHLISVEDKTLFDVKMDDATTELLNSIIEHSFIDPTAEIDPADFKDISDVIRFAIEEEKDTIVFYQCLKNAISEPTIMRTLSEIIQHEITHMLELTKRQKQLAG